MAVTFIAQEFSTSIIRFLLMSVFGGVNVKVTGTTVRCTHKSCKKFVRSVFLDD